MSGQTEQFPHPHDIASRTWGDGEAIKRLIDANILAVCRVDLLGNVYEINQAQVELLGYSQEEYAQGVVKYEDLTPPEYKRIDEEAFKELKQTGKAGPYAKAMVHKEGHHVPVLVGLTLLGEKTDQVYCFAIDLSELRSVEAKLREEKSRFQLLAETIPQIVWIADVHGRVKYFNKRFYEATGLDPKDDDGYLWRYVIHPDDMSQILAAQRRWEKEGGVLELEIRYLMADGSYRWQLVRGVPTCDSGESGEWFGTTTDIDDSKRAQEELMKSESRMRMLADAIPQIVWTADANGQITFFNHRWFEYTGLTLEQSLNRGWTLLIHADDRDAYLSEWEKAIKTGDTFEIEFRVKRVAGLGRVSGNPYRWHLGRAVAHRGSNGEILEWFGTWTEIEPQRRKSRS
ncbi:MAG TPA: PAS domain-containing protein [Candidatus Obscuribacterales bacterium]